MNYYVYIVLLIGSLVSCSESSRHFPRYEDFPDEKVLNAQVIHLDTALFRYPFRIAVKDGIAIIMDLHNVDYFFHAFSYPEWEYMTSFGKRGKGPEEMVSADCFRFISKDSIWTLDANKMRTTRWKIEQNMNNIIPVETIDMDKRLVRALDFYPMESGFLVSDYLGEYRQKWTDREGKWIHSANQIPTENNYEDIARPALAQAWRSFFDYNPQKGILVMATQLGEALEIYNFTDTTQTVRYGPNGEPQFAISQSEEFQRVSWDSVMFISQTISFIPYFMAVVSKISGRHTNEGKISRMAGDTSMYSTSKETPSGSTCSTMPFMVST